MHPGAQMKPTGEYLGYELSWLHDQSKHYPVPNESAGCIKTDKQRQNLKKRREAAIWPTKQGALVLKAQADQAHAAAIASVGKSGGAARSSKGGSSQLSHGLHGRTGRLVGAAKRKRTVADQSLYDISEIASVRYVGVFGTGATTNSGVSVTGGPGGGGGSGARYGLDPIAEDDDGDITSSSSARSGIGRGRGGGKAARKAPLSPTPVEGGGADEDADDEYPATAPGLSRGNSELGFLSEPPNLAGTRHDQAHAHFEGNNHTGVGGNGAAVDASAELMKTAEQIYGNSNDLTCSEEVPGAVPPPPPDSNHIGLTTWSSGVEGNGGAVSESGGATGSDGRSVATDGMATAQANAGSGFGSGGVGGTVLTAQAHVEVSTPEASGSAKSQPYTIRIATNQLPVAVVQRLGMKGGLPAEGEVPPHPPQQSNGRIRKPSAKMMEMSK